VVRTTQKTDYEGNIITLISKQLSINIYEQ